MILLDLHLHNILRTGPANFLRMRETNNSILFAINKHNPRFDLGSSTSNIQLEGIQILILFLHVVFNWLNYEVYHQFGDTGCFRCDFYCCSLEGTEWAVQDYALHFFVHVAGLGEDD